MSNVLYGGAKPLYTDLLKFTAQSLTTVEHSGEKYHIFHTQYASYAVKEAFDILASETELHPHDLDFAEEAEEAITHAGACLTDTDMQRHYNKREYICPRDFHRAMQGYQMEVTHTGTARDELFQNPSEDRLESLAEAFSYYLAENASLSSSAALTSGINSDDHHKIDDGFDRELAIYAVLDTIRQHGEHGVITQPQPTLPTVKAIYDILSEVGCTPKLRHVYGLYCCPSPLNRYEPEDATGRQITQSLGDVINSAMIGHTTDRNAKWASVDEPPIETLESYTELENQSD